MTSFEKVFLLLFYVLVYLAVSAFVCSFLGGCFIFSSDKNNDNTLFRWSTLDILLTISCVMPTLSVWHGSGYDNVDMFDICDLYLLSVGLATASTYTTRFCEQVLLFVRKKNNDFIQLFISFSVGI